MIVSLSQLINEQYLSADLNFEKFSKKKQLTLRMAFCYLKTSDTLVKIHYNFHSVMSFSFYKIIKTSLISNKNQIFNLF